MTTPKLTGRVAAPILALAHRAGWERMTTIAKRHPRVPTQEQLILLDKWHAAERTVELAEQMARAASQVAEAARLAATSAIRTSKAANATLEAALATADAAAVTAQEAATAVGRAETASTQRDEALTYAAEDASVARARYRDRDQRAAAK